MDSGSRSNSNSRSISNSRSWKQRNGLNNLDHVKPLLKLEVKKFIFLTQTCENTFLKVHGAKHALLILRFKDGSLVLTDFGADGTCWKTMNLSTQFGQYTKISSYSNPCEYSLQDVVDCPNEFSKKYHVTDNNCFHYVGYILTRMTSCTGEVYREIMNSMNYQIKDSGSSSNSNSRKINDSSGYKQVNGLNNLDLVQRCLLETKLIEEFMFFYSKLGARHGFLALRLTDGSIVLTDIEADGTCWRTINQTQIRQYTKILAYPNPSKYSQFDVMECLDEFKEEFPVHQKGLYVYYILTKMTSCTDEVYLEKINSKGIDAVLVGTDVALVGVGVGLPFVGIKNLDLLEHLLDLEVVEFIFVSRPCEGIFLKVHGAKHAMLVLRLIDGSLVLTDFGENGKRWITIDQTQLNQLTQKQAYPNPRHYSLYDVVKYSDRFGKKYDVMGQNCFHYVQYILRKVTSYQGEASIENEKSKDMVGLSLVTDVALIGVSIVAGPIGLIALGGKFIINILK